MTGTLKDNSYRKSTGLQTEDKILMRLIIAGPEMSQGNVLLRGLGIVGPPTGIITERSTPPVKYSAPRSLKGVTLITP